MHVQTTREIMKRLGAFHWTKTFWNLETEENGTEFPGKDSGICWISEMRTIRPKIREIPGANRTFQLNRKRPIVYHHFTPRQGSLVLHRRKTLSLKEGNLLQTQLKFLLDYKTVHFFDIQVKLWLHAIATAMSRHACLALSSLASRLLSLSLKKAKK